ncbi:MAG: hypothetical protein U9O64_01715 [Campylobacterota bacterium]|nr:hypothetical protein [Campylobacterota bacterium]
MSGKYQKSIDTAKAELVEDAGLLYTGVVPSTIQQLTSNFQFLKQHDPNTTIVKLRQLAEALAKDIASQFNILTSLYSSPPKKKS